MHNLDRPINQSVSCDQLNVRTRHPPITNRVLHGEKIANDLVIPVRVSTFRSEISQSSCGLGALHCLSWIESIHPDVDSFFVDDAERRLATVDRSTDAELGISPGNGWSRGGGRRLFWDWRRNHDSLVAIQKWYRLVATKGAGGHCSYARRWQRRGSPMTQMGLIAGRSGWGWQHGLWSLSRQERSGGCCSSKIGRVKEGKRMFLSWGQSKQVACTSAVIYGSWKQCNTQKVNKHKIEKYSDYHILS